MTKRRKLSKNKTKKNIKKYKKTNHLRSKTRNHKRIRNRTKRSRLYGGEDIDEASRLALQKLQKEKTQFRRELTNNLNSIVNNLKNGHNSKVIDAITNITTLFADERYKHLINTLIPISQEGDYVDKERNENAKIKIPIVNFVSPINILFNFDSLKRKLSKVKQVPSHLLPIEYLLVAYFNGGGNFNLLTSKKIKEGDELKFMTPLQYEIYRGRWDNVDILLNPEQPFYESVINPEYYDEKPRRKVENHRQEIQQNIQREIQKGKQEQVLQQLQQKIQEKIQQKLQQRQVLQQLQQKIKEKRQQKLQQKRSSPINRVPLAQQKTRRVLPVQDIQGSLPRQQIKTIKAKSKLSKIATEFLPKLELLFKFPSNELEYNRDIVPKFWQPLFPGIELILLRNMFLKLYYDNSQASESQKTWTICKILERLFPSYLPINYLNNIVDNNNVNFLNCFITLMYGIILYKLYSTNQNYLFIFKGGRAIQIGLQDIHEKFFSVDTDILIIPNKKVNADYNLIKMNSLSGHIGFLIKWMIPQELNISVNMPKSSYNKSEDVTKIMYNNGSLHVALSDIGINKISDEAEIFFSESVEFSLNIEELKPLVQYVLYIIPTIDNMLYEKLYYYSKYYSIYLKVKQENDEKKQKLQNLIDNLKKNEKNYRLKLIDKNSERDHLIKKLKNTKQPDNEGLNSLRKIHILINILNNERKLVLKKIEGINKEIDMLQNNKQLNESMFFIEKFKKSLYILLRNMLIKDDKEINRDSKAEILTEYLRREKFSDLTEKESIINSLLGP